jgi:hypothetical protein
VAQRGGAAKVTTDHDFIRRWVEQRGGCPATVKRTSRGGDPGLLRIDYPGFSGATTLVPISWDEFFDKFEDNNLAFLYQDKRDSRFSKLVARETMQSRERGEKVRSARRRNGARAGARTQQGERRTRTQRQPQQRQARGQTTRRTPRASTSGRASQRSSTRTRAQSQRRRAK